MPLPMALPPVEKRPRPGEPAVVEGRSKAEAVQLPLPFELPPEKPRVAAKGPYSPSFYFPTPTAEEQDALDDSIEADLRPEVVLVRVVLKRLLAYLDENAGDLPPDELRRVAGLVFSGARTVAQLLNHKSANTTDAQRWLTAALAEMSSDLPQEL